MKKIISILVVAMILAGCIFAAVPASAATTTTTTTKTFEVDWTALAFTTYNEHGTEIDEFTFLDSFEVTKNATTLGVSRIGGGIQSNSYISTSQFAITTETDYTYEVMAKNNNSLKYSGVPFAIDTDGMVYFVYGSFNNKNDTDGAPSTNMSYVISAKGDFNKKYPNTLGETNEVYFKKLQLSSDGFASMKFEYKGLTVSVYVKDGSGNYSHIGEDITLPEGSKLAFGVFSRDNHNDGNRTTTIKNAKITANNEKAVANMVLQANNGAGDLKAEISKVEKEYLEVDYSNFNTVKSALENAKTVAEDSFSTADEVSAAMEELKNAVAGLELADPDFTELEAVIAEAEALDKSDYTALSFNMVTGALEEAKALMEETEVKQSQVNAAVETLQGRIDGLVPANGVDPSDDEEEDADATETMDESISDTNAAQQTGVVPNATQPVAEVGGRGCGASVAATAVVLGIVATLGTTLVIKKKD